MGYRCLFPICFSRVYRIERHFSQCHQEITGQRQEKLFKAWEESKVLFTENQTIIDSLLDTSTIQEQSQILQIESAKKNNKADQKMWF